MTDQSPLTEPIEPLAFEPLAVGNDKRRRGFNPWRWLLLATVLAFVAIMSFLLSARSVQITVQAESDVDITLDGGWYLSFGERYLLHRGRYQASVTAAGYYPIDSVINVSAEETQLVQLTLRPLPGRLDVASQPSDAKVLIDGDLIGKTPVKAKPVQAGQHHLRIDKARYLPLEKEISIHGRDIQQQLVLPLEPAWAEISIDSQPQGAIILVDGEVQGRTPAVVEMLQGERQLILQKETYSDSQQTLIIVASEKQDLGRLTLQAAAGTVHLVSVPGQANVTVDGEFRGQTPLKLTLSPGQQHTLAVFKPGYQHYTSELELSAGTHHNRRVELLPHLGEVHFNIEPQTAILMIDGQAQGQGSRRLELPATEHSVEVVLEGYASVHRKVTPRTGLQQVVTVTLVTEREAQLSKLKPEVNTLLGQTLLLFTPDDFIMGASRREPGRRPNEVLHPVSLSRMFYLQTTEITNAEFRIFLASHSSGQIEANSLNREHQPVVQVSWQQAAQFCNWLSTKEGLTPFYRQAKGIVTGYNRDAIGYRLPTEAEWAWAARVQADLLLKFPWGESFPPTEAVENYADRGSAHVTGRVLNKYQDGHVVSATVGSYPANKKGLYDMGGNVAEWVHDVYLTASSDAIGPADPTGPQSGDNYVIRGASWAHSRISELRLSFRDYGQAGRDDVGFRIARYVE